MSMKDSYKSLKQTQKRVCLKCQKKFNSVWIGHRICYDCKEEVEALYDSGYKVNLPLMSELPKDRLEV